MSATIPTSAVPPSFAQKNSKSGSRLFLPGLLSALLPGAGHLLLKRSRKGLLIMSAYASLFIACFWLRLPLLGVAVELMALVALCVLAASDAVYGGQCSESKPTQWWLAALLPIALLAGGAHAQLALRASGLQTFTAAGSSMSPAVPEGSHLVVDRRYYRHKGLRRGDIIVFDAPARRGVLLFKRVVAIGGDTIKIEGDTVYLNGVPLSEPYARFDGPGSDLPWVAPNTLPAGKVFVSGDNRHLSFDSRFAEFGLIDITAVRGKVIYALPSLGSEIKKFD